MNHGDQKKSWQQEDQFEPNTQEERGNAEVHDFNQKMMRALDTLATVYAVFEKAGANLDVDNPERDILPCRCGRRHGGGWEGCTKGGSGGGGHGYHDGFEEQVHGPGRDMGDGGRRSKMEVPGEKEVVTEKSSEPRREFDTGRVA